MIAVRTSVKFAIVGVLPAVLAVWVYSARDVYAENAINCRVSLDLAGQTIDFATNRDITCTGHSITRTTWFKNTPFATQRNVTVDNVSLNAQDFVAHVYGKDEFYEHRFLDICFKTMKRNVKNLGGDDLAYWRSTETKNFPAMSCQRLNRVE